MQRNLLLQGKHHFLVAALHLYHVLRAYLNLKSILDLDAICLCCSLVGLQEVLDHHGVSDVAECIEKGKNLLM